MTVNANLCALHGSYLFSETAARVAAFSQENPGKTLLRLGIGDVTLPVADAVVRALCAAAEEMGRPDGVHGYAPTAGYPFAIEAVRNGYYAPMSGVLIRFVWQRAGCACFRLLAGTEQCANRFP